MKKLLTLFCFISILNFGCEKKKCCVIVDRNVTVSYVDANNVDLLDPANPDAIKADDIEIYYLENGNKKRVYNGNYDLSKSIKILKTPNNDKYYLSVTVSGTVDEKGLGTTYIEVKKLNFIDTLTATINKVGASTHVGKVWYNGVYNGDGVGAATLFTIVK